MSRRCFADDLKGDDWGRVLSERKQVLGTGGAVLDDETVPEAFRHTLPYASLLTTGEEGTLSAFWSSMSAPARDHVMKTIEPIYKELRAFGLRGPRSREREALLDLARFYDLFEVEWYERSTSIKGERE